ncbi:MAG TPA: hypothetical protein VNA69_17415 [Thermoanaerobaculia bacterium]|nr:hypothetical protein [Thermoanaerobaculia bacterium]
MRFFAFVAGIALFLAAVFGVQSAQGAGWLLPAAGLLLGAALLFVCWRGLAPGYSITANAIGGAGVGTLYAAVAMLLPNSWTAVLWAFEAATLVVLYRRFAKTTLLVWAIGLAVVVALWITFDSPLYIWWVFVAIGMAMYVATYFAEERNVRLFFSLVGLTEHWLLINILIAGWYDSTGVALNSSFGFASPVEDVTYTVAWAVVAAILFIIGVLLPWRGARVGAVWGEERRRGSGGRCEVIPCPGNLCTGCIACHPERQRGTWGLGRPHECSCLAPPNRPGPSLTLGMTTYAEVP